MIRTFFATAAFMLLLSSCTAYTPKPLDPARGAEELQARSLLDPGLAIYTRASAGGDSTPPMNWDLRRLTLAALYFQPDLDLARATWRTAEAAVATAGQRPNPSLTLDLQHLLGGGRVWNRGVAFALPFETAGKRGLRVAAAQHRAEAARLDLRGTAWHVRSRVRAALVDLDGAERALALRGERSAAADRIVTLLDKRLALGAASRPEVTQAHLSSTEARVATQDERRRRDEAQARLAAAIGVPVAALADVDLSFGDFAGPLPAGEELPLAALRTAALLERAGIRRSLAEYEATQAALQLEVAKQFPDLELGPGYSYEGGTHRLSIALTLTLPILHHNQGGIAEAEARRNEAAARFTTVQAGVLAELDSTRATYLATRAGWEQAKDLGLEIERRRREIVARFAAGAADRLDLASAELEATSASLAVLDARTRAQSALGELEGALQQQLGPAEQGGASPPPDAETDPKATQGGRR